MRRSWDYRVLEFREPYDDSLYRQIHEVHYEDLRPVSYTENPAVVMWDVGDDPKKILEKMSTALDKDVLIEKDFHTGEES